MTPKPGRKSSIIFALPILLGLWILRLYMRDDILGLPAPLNSDAAHWCAWGLLLLVLAILIWRDWKNPKVMRDGDVGGWYGPTHLILLPMTLALLAPVLVLYLMFDSLPANIQTFLRAEAMPISLTILAVSILIFLWAVVRNGRPAWVIGHVLVWGGLVLAYALLRHNLTKAGPFSIPLLGYVWLGIGALLIAAVVTPRQRPRKSQAAGA